MAGGEPFQSMDMGKANEQCARRNATTFTACAKCDSRVGLHCDTCKIQVTGCICTEIERFGNADAVKRAIDRWGEDEARRRLSAAGVWIPPGSQN